MVSWPVFIKTDYCQVRHLTFEIKVRLGKIAKWHYSAFYRHSSVLHLMGQDWDLVIYRQRMSKAEFLHNKLHFLFTGVLTPLCIVFVWEKKKILHKCIFSSSFLSQYSKWCFFKCFCFLTSQQYSRTKSCLYLDCVRHLAGG